MLATPPVVDHEPRTYLGWRAPSGEEVCCGADTDSAISADVDALGTEPFFPTLLFGSPLGYRTEIAYNFWTPSLVSAMVTALVPAAFKAGIRCIVAPWIPDRKGNEALVDALNHAGGHSTFWGYEDFMRLDAADWEGHLAALPLKKRQRIKGDVRRAEAAGVMIQRVDGADIRPYAERIAELTCLNREKNSAGEEPSHILGLLTALLDEGADVRAYLGFKDGALVASCVTIRKNHRLFPKWAGFDYAAIGERSGISLLSSSTRRSGTPTPRACARWSSAPARITPRSCAAAPRGLSPLPWCWPTPNCAPAPTHGSTLSAAAAEPHSVMLPPRAPGLCSLDRAQRIKHWRLLRRRLTSHVDMDTDEKEQP